MSDWHGRLRTLVMAAPNPDDAAQHMGDRAVG